MKLTIFGIGGLPEFVAGDDLAQIIGDAVSLGTVSTGSIRLPNLSTGTIPIQRADAADGSRYAAEGGYSTDGVAAGGGYSTGGGREPENSILHDGDILAVTSKIVSKAEGRQIVAADREDAITAETVRVVATRGHTRIVENRLGLVLAAAGVDASNTPDGTVLLLPVDPDATAHHLASTLRARLGVRIGIIITDTIGRPWRNGQVDIAIGAAGIRVLDDLRGQTDTSGRQMDVTVQATADELASAADLIKGKTTGMPVAIIRGLGHLVGDLSEPGARSVVRPSEEDLFRLGSREAYELGYRAGLAAQAAAQGAAGQGAAAPAPAQGLPHG